MNTQQPKQKRLEGESQNLWYYKARLEELIVEYSLMCLRTVVGDKPNKSFKAEIPQLARQDIIELTHNSTFTGHLYV